MYGERINGADSIHHWPVGADVMKSKDDRLSQSSRDQRPAQLDHHNVVAGDK